MRFVVDEDVPESAATYLEERGHEVTRCREVLMAGSEDHLVAKLAHENEAIVVTCNVRHFRGIIRRPSYSRAGLLALPQPNARARLEQFIELLEWEDALAAGERRVVVEIRETSVLIAR